MERKFMHIIKLKHAENFWSTFSWADKVIQSRDDG